MDCAWNRRMGGLALAALVFGLDQLVKWLVTGPLGIDTLGDVQTVLPFFDLRFTQNFGISLGLFEANSVETRWILVAGTALIAVIVLLWMLRERAGGDIFGLGLILGGALGNITDRVLFGYVIDYADLHFGTFRPFLIFNVADAAITIGVLIILARSFFLRDKGAEDDDMQLAAKES
ncbi:signal peptidase II [Citromicrobium bathyomarinum]|uniref:signal peptidase II n=1 Tax=Citromicrobium bathyomarinum TaxID=72174 RepID=UPI00315A9B2F